MKNIDTKLISIPKCYQWIEAILLKIPIANYKKRTIDLVLVPYLINIKNLEKGDVKNIITN